MRKVRVEDYLVVIDQICEGKNSILARSGQIAKALGIANGTASSTLLKLAADGLIIHQPYGGVQLTDVGRFRAQHVTRRISIIERFLGNLLGWEPEPANNEARHLEPVISDRLIEALDAFLNIQKSDHSGPASLGRGS